MLRRKPTSSLSRRHQRRTVQSGTASRTRPTAAMAVDNKRNEEVTLPVSKVTGSSGNTEKGSLITYSGGARG